MGHNSQRTTEATALSRQAGHRRGFVKGRLWVNFDWAIPLEGCAIALLYCSAVA